MKPQIIRCTEPRPAHAPPVLKEELYRRDAFDFNVVRVAPGSGKPPHPYDEGESFMLVLDGALHLQVEGEIYVLAPGHMAIIPKGAVRGFTAGETGASFFAAHLRD